MQITRIRWIDASRGLAIVGVVLLHASHWLAAVGVHSTAAEWVIARLVVPLPVLFLVSGVVARRSLDDPAAFRRRLTTLAWLFVLWQPVVLGYRVLGDAALGRDVDIAGELLRTVVAPIRPNGELWYLWALAIHLLVARWTRHLPTVPVVAAAAVLFVGWGGFGSVLLGDVAWHVLGPGLQGLPQFLLFTLVGARMSPRTLDRIRTASPITAGLWVAVWLAVGEAAWRTPLALQPLFGPVQIAVGTIATILLARQLAGRRWSGWLDALGRRSLAPYLGHTAVIVAMMAGAVAAGATSMLRATPEIALLGAVALGTVVPLLFERTCRTAPTRVLFAAPTSLLDRAGDGSDGIRQDSKRAR